MNASNTISLAACKLVYQNKVIYGLQALSNSCTRFIFCVKGLKQELNPDLH